MSLRCAVLTLAVVCLCSGEKNYQRWSDQTYLDEPHAFHCNDSKQEGVIVYVNIGDTLVWSRHYDGEVHTISDDEHFELNRMNEIDNMELVIKSVKGELSGMYFCDVYNTTGGHVGRIVRGLNLGHRKYHDAIDKYRESIITGVIAAACVFVLVVGVCALDNFRYLTDEQKEKRRERKEERLRKRREMKNGEFNQAMDMSEGRNGKYPDGQNGPTQTEVNTHL